MWHPVHSDLFAVSYGSFDWVRQGAGGVAVFTLKNTSAPEHYFTAECGVPCRRPPPPPPRGRLGHLSTPVRTIFTVPICCKEE